MKILGASIGSCVHTVGLLNFLDLAKQNGFEVIYLGAAIPVDKVVAAIEKENPELVALSYRLSAEPLHNLLTELEKTLKKKQLLNRTYVFGGTFEAANEAKKFEFINKTFDGSEEIEDIIMFLRGT
ncbi:MAG: methionine synthase, partial [Thermotogae bacterium]